MTGPKILVVEDHKDSRLWIAAVLCKSGYTTIEAADGALAVRLARSEKPDLILLDMHLPCGGGDFVIEAIRKHEACAKIPVIIMSGDAQLDEAALAEKGAVAVFRKPVDVHAFLRAVKDWTGKEVPELTPA